LNRLRIAIDGDRRQPYFKYGSTASASVAVNESPGELIFDPNDCPNRTVKVVPAGTTTGGGGVGVVCCAGVEDVIALPPAFPPALLPPPELPEFEAAELVAAELAAVLSAGFEQAAIITKSARVSA
jgi:hypothetical protein